jgi:Fungal domain of unknown function (DUF1750)
MIPITDMRAQQTRMYLQSQGQIVQKEFMLHDRTNWPQIQFPRGQLRSGQYPGVMAQPRIPQSMAYPPHSASTALGPPPKRARTQTSQIQGPPVIGAPPPVEIDDEEDTSRGDLFDQTTPREVSISRFKQNHEWMEEIFSSPYSISQIEPVDLGFGLRGELGNLTDGIFHAPTGIEHVQNGYVSKLDPVKTDDFRKRVSEHVADTIAEMEKMKARHAKRMVKVRKGALMTEAEKALRTAIHSPGDIGPEYWRLEGRIENTEDSESLKIASKIQGSVNDIVAKVEASLGRHAVAVQELRRIQDGGLEESPVLPSTPPSRQGSRTGSQQSGVLIGDADIDMGGSAADALEQFHTGFSSTSTPGNSFPTPQAHLQVHSSIGTPADVSSPQPAAPNAVAPAATSSGGNTENADAGAASKDRQGNSDWVVVPPGGVSPQSDSAGQTTLDAGATALQSAPSTSPHQTPQAEAMDNGQNLDMDLSDNFATDVNDFGSLEDLDTAGEALASFGDGDDHGDSIGGDLDLGMDMGMDDSAFGDAFHGVEPRDGEEGDGI